MQLTKDEIRILHLVRHYPEWVDTVNTISTVRAITYDGDKVQTSPEDTMLEMAIQIERFQELIDCVEYCLKVAFVTDGKVDRARRILCYGESSKNVPDWKQFCVERKHFAREMMEVRDGK